MPEYTIKEHIEENHASQKAKYVKNIIYGGLDGIITTFSIIAAAVGANLEMKTIIAMGVANLIADGLSMGLGDYLSSHFENKYINSEKEKEEYEYIHNRDYEIEELIEPKASDPKPFLLVVDGVTDPGNLGAILRSAECAGVTGVVLPRHRSARVTPAVTKTSAGAIEHLRIATAGGIPAADPQDRSTGR